jgi:DNA invertase Pin-like site-specific DNA recombinase
MAVIGYVRVSSVKQVDEGASLDAQRESIRTYCKLHGLHLVDIVADEGISAKDAENRPGLQQLLGMIRRKIIDGLIVYKLDRLARNTRDAIAISELCRRQSVALHSIQEHIDTNSAIGGFFFTLMAALAELERKQIGERTAAVLRHKQAKGEKTGGLVPFGYKVIGQADETPIIDVDSAEQAVIDFVMKCRASNMTYREISKRLESRRILTKTGKSRWHPQTIKQVFERRGRLIEEQQETA